jgi:hypothetical protein
MDRKVICRGKGDCDGCSWTKMHSLKFNSSYSGVIWTLNNKKSYCLSDTTNLQIVRYKQRGSLPLAWHSVPLSLLITKKELKTLPQKRALRGGLWLEGVSLLFAVGTCSALQLEHVSLLCLSCVPLKPASLSPHHDRSILSTHSLCPLWPIPSPGLQQPYLSSVILVCVFQQLVHMDCWSLHCFLVWEAVWLLLAPGGWQWWACWTAQCHSVVSVRGSRWGWLVQKDSCGCCVEIFVWTHGFLSLK